MNFIPSPHAGIKGYCIKQAVNKEITTYIINRTMPVTILAQRLIIRIKKSKYDKSLINFINKLQEKLY